MAFDPNANTQTLAERIRVELLDGGQIWQVSLAVPKANIIDRAMTSALTEVFVAAKESSMLKGVCICGDGEHFSFGASVEEHLPDEVGAMLRGFHGLFRAMLDARVVTVAAVRGQCLGGGLEVASFCNRVFADPNARLGQPEIVLGVIAPVGSVFLHERVGRGAAEDLLLTGRAIDADEARSIGLVDEIDADSQAAALAYLREHMLPKSASSLRFAVQAARLGVRERFVADLERAERLYLSELAGTADAEEGIRAFLDKRAPVWGRA